MSNIWITEITNIDVETGEIISKEEAKKHYQIIKRIKTVDHGHPKYAGIVKYTNECKRKPEQLTINFEGTN